MTQKTVKKFGAAKAPSLLGLRRWVAAGTGITSQGRF
jgi:hypothetical protein